MCDDGTYQEFWVENPWTTQFRCKICPDAVGLLADIAAGDCWPGGWPQAEDDGWNSVIAHTEQGAEVLRESEDAGTLVAEESGPQTLFDAQDHHVELRRMLIARLAAIRATGIPAPNWNGLALERCAAEVDPDALGANFAGTIRRIRKGHGDAPAVADYAPGQGQS